MRFRRARLSLHPPVLAALALLLTVPVPGQSPSAPPPASAPQAASQTAPAAAPPPLSPNAAPDTPAYTLRTESRIVLLDVTVTDRKGNPVHNLPQSAFHIDDDKHAETVSHFEEHTLSDTSASVAQPARSRGVYSNDLVRRAPPVLNILLLDISTLGVEDQMFLDYELNRLLDTLPFTGSNAQPLAIYLRSSGASVMLEDFTTDRDRLRAALHRALPRLFQPNPYLDDLYTLHQIASAVAELPGRKNLLWFSGGARQCASNAAILQGDPLLYRDNATVRAVYDELETARIAVYPIDARGLTITGGLCQMAQHSIMDEVAQATGGRAVYNNNGIALAAGRFLDSDRSFYSLTYSPTNFRLDHRWHTVRVQLDDPALRLSYRSGYFSDGTGAAAPTVPETRARLRADGSLARDAGLPAAAPIVFEAQVLPVSDPAVTGAPPPVAQLTGDARSSHGSVPYSIRYTVPAEDFHVQTVNGKPSLVVDVAAIAFNLNGTAVAHTAQKITLSIKPGRLSALPGTRIPLVQQIALAKGDLSLYLAVWDATSGRVGTLEIPLQVKPEKR